MQATVASHPGAPAIAPHALSRPVRPLAAARRCERRRGPAPMPAVDPTAAALFAYEAQEFGLALLGMGLVTGFASTAFAVRGAAGAAVTAAGGAVQRAGAAAAAKPAATAANLLVEESLTVAAASTLETVFQQPSTVGLGDIKAQLQAAADAAVAAVKSAADAPRPPAPVSRRAPTDAPNGAAVRPGLTLEEATRQVKEMMKSLGIKGEEGQQQQQQATSTEGPREPLEFPAPSAIPATTRVTEPSMPPSAAAVLSAMTANAPVANSPPGAAAAGAASAAGDEPEPVLVAAAAAGPDPSGAEQEEPASGEEAKEREGAYKARIAAVKADAKMTPGGAAQQQEQERRKAVEVAPAYQAKIASLWDKYQQKRAQEQELMAKSDAILRNLAEMEAEEKQKLVAAASAEQPSALAAQARQAEQQLQPASLFAQLLQQLAALFRAVQQFVQQLVARLTGNGGSSAAGGASA